ncbi:MULTISPECIES: hypothetical protein [unclassified Microcoleus]|uniref:hypothetical protein n=1 Tax=unclassified Microcoleus TaxID=2642155 RepID=UPI002FD6D494
MKAAQLENGVLRQETVLLRGRRKESEGRSQKKYFYKYERLPILQALPSQDHKKVKLNASQEWR